MTASACDFMDEVLDALGPSGLMGDSLETEDIGEQADLACTAIIKATRDRAALLTVMEQVRALTYDGADRLHNMTMKEKARFLASSLVAIATVASVAIKEASGPDCRPTNP